MRKLISAGVVCALAIGLVAVPGAVAKKGPKLVPGTVSVNVSPNPLADSVTTVAASGNVASSSSCRKNRTVHLYWVINGVQGSEVGTATTGPNGDYSVPNVGRPPGVNSTTLPVPTVTLRATVDQVNVRFVGKKKGHHRKKGRVFVCQGIPVAGSPPADSSPVTLIAG